MSDDRTTIETVAEALAGVIITDPDFDGLSVEDWRKLAEAALKAIRYRKEDEHG